MFVHSSNPRFVLSNKPPNWKVILSLLLRHTKRRLQTELYCSVLALAELNSRAGKLYNNEEIAMEKFMESTK
jgi:hypothetical protein